MEYIPEEIIISILLYLNIKEIKIFSLLCTRYGSLSCDIKLWKEIMDSEGLTTNLLKDNMSFNQLLTIYNYETQHIKYIRWATRLMKVIKTGDISLILTRKNKDVEYVKNWLRKVGNMGYSLEGDDISMYYDIKKEKYYIDIGTLREEYSYSEGPLAEVICEGAVYGRYREYIEDDVTYDIIYSGLKNGWDICNSHFRTLISMPILEYFST
ncbi:F-box domain-containing protein [Orpheovirus IHUMI-LCC2]|uniref:F-box domain-containing protein n=1 Tax=Orpheovirus IHUMI-LCC2 TaxID=2023057 RepID=A0A2I2L367_9VIRU|nr:F-box domain-containing protein [Orpheovirus IHUMI-LCC2]SNW61974.1 F-box domain-containing protein [Orpheovirus IHUMI-LCC2]